ncbi:MAG: HAD hydrolase-like protein [Alkalispirochaeta sp.]
MSHNDSRQAHSIFVGIDSDGCAFDTMEVKHRRCFAPEYVRHFGLETHAEPAEETWHFVNLYSATRGINRYTALAKTLDLLPSHPAMAHAREIPGLPAFHRWVDTADALSADSLTREIERIGSSTREGRNLELVRRWSQAVDRSFEGIVAEVEPFSGVAEALRELYKTAEVAVISHAPTSVLRRQWALYGLDRWVGAINGQESGKKSQHLAAARTSGGYAPARMLMIGDAPGDFAAARSVGASFFPILPGEEGASWERFRREGWPRFLEGAWGSDYQNVLLREFYDRLPSAAPWNR